MLADGSTKEGRSSLAGAAASSLRAALQPTPQELDSLFRPTSVDDASVRALLQCCIDGGLWAWGMQVTAVYCAYQCSAVGAERAVMIPPLRRLAEAVSACPTAAPHTMGGSDAAEAQCSSASGEVTPSGAVAACEHSTVRREPQSTGNHVQQTAPKAAAASPERVPLSLLPTPAFSVLAHFMRACRAGAQQLQRRQGGKPGSVRSSPPPDLRLRLEAGIVRAVYADCGLRLGDRLGAAARSSRADTAGPGVLGGRTSDTTLQLGGAASHRPPHVGGPFALQAMPPTSLQQRPHTRSRCVQVDCHGSPLLAADWLLRSLLHLHYAPFPSSVRQHPHEGYLASPPPAPVPGSAGEPRAAGGKHARHNSAAVLPVLLGHMKDGGAPATSAASTAAVSRVAAGGGASLRSHSLSLGSSPHSALDSSAGGAPPESAVVPISDFSVSRTAVDGAFGDAAAAAAVPHPLAGRPAWVRGAGVSTALLASLFARPLARHGGDGRRQPAGPLSAPRARSPHTSPLSLSFSRGQLAVQRAAWDGVRWEVRQLLESLLSDLAFHGAAAGTGGAAVPSLLPTPSLCPPLPAAAAAHSRSAALAAAVLGSAPASAVGNCSSAAAGPALAALRIAADVFDASSPRARLGPGHVLALMRCYGQLGQPHLAVELFERGYWAHVTGAAAPEPAAQRACDAAGTDSGSGVDIEGAADARSSLVVLLAPAEATASLGLRTPHARRQGLPRLALAVGLSAMQSHAGLLGIGRAEAGPGAAAATGNTTLAQASPAASHPAAGIAVRAGPAGLPAPAAVLGPVPAPPLPRRSLLGRLTDRLGCATKPEGATHASSERGSAGAGQCLADGREEGAAAEMAPAARALHSALVEQALRAYTRCLQYEWLPSAHLSLHQQHVTPHRQHATDGSGGSYRVSLRPHRPAGRVNASAEDSSVLSSATACDEAALAALPGRASARVSALLRSLDALGCPRSDSVTNATATFLLAAARHAATRAGALGGSGRSDSGNGVSALTAPGGVATAFSAAQAAAGEATRLAMLGASGGIGWTTLTVVQSVAQLAAGGQRVSVHTLTTALRSLLRGCAAAAAEQGAEGGADGWRRVGGAFAAEGWQPPRHLTGAGARAGGRDGASPLLARAWSSWEQNLLAAALPGVTAAPGSSGSGTGPGPALLPSSSSSSSSSASVALPHQGANPLPGTTSVAAATPLTNRHHSGAAGGPPSAVSPTSLLQLMRSVAHGLLATAAWVQLPQHEAAAAWSAYLAAVAAIESSRPSADAMAAAGRPGSSGQTGHGNASNPQPRPAWLLAVEQVPLADGRDASDAVTHAAAGVWLPPEVAAFAPGATTGPAAPSGHAGRSGPAPTPAAMPLDPLALVYAGRALAALADAPSAASAVRCLLLHYGASLHGSAAVLGRSHAAVQAQATAAGQPAVPLRLPPPPASARGSTPTGKRGVPAAEVWSQQKGPQQPGDGPVGSATASAAAATVYLPDLRPATPLARLLCPLLELLQCQRGPEGAFDAAQALLFTPDAGYEASGGSAGTAPTRPVSFSRPCPAALAGLDAAGYIALMRLCATVTARGSRPGAVAAATHTHDTLCAMQGLPTLTPQPRPQRIVINAAVDNTRAGTAGSVPAAPAAVDRWSSPSRPSLVWSEGTFAAAAGVLVAALPRGIAARQTRFPSPDAASTSSASQSQVPRAPHLLARDRASAAALPATAESLLRHMLEVSLAPGPHSGAALFAVLLAEGAVRGGERDAGVLSALSRSRYGGLSGARTGAWGSDDEGDAAPPPALEASRGAQLLLAASGVGRGLPLAESLSMVQRAAAGRSAAGGFSSPWRRGFDGDGSQLPLAAERIVSGFGQAGACLVSLTDACSAPAARQLLLPLPEATGAASVASQLAGGEAGAATLSLDDAMHQATLALELGAAYGSARGSGSTSVGSRGPVSSPPPTRMPQEHGPHPRLRHGANTGEDKEAGVADGEEAEEEAAAALLSLGTALRWYHDSVKGLLAPLRLESRQHRGRVRRSLLPFVRPASGESATPDTPVLGATSDEATRTETRHPFALSAEQLRRSRAGSASRARMQLR